MEAYSLELRARVVGAYDRGEGTQAQLAERFAVSERWIQKLVRQRREWDSRAPLPRKGGRKAKIRGEKLVLLQAALAQTPDASPEELRDACGIDGSPMCVFRALRRLRITRKKKTPHPAERPDPKVQEQRRQWWARTAGVDPRRFKFLDQTNAKAVMTRWYGRAPRGQRVRESVPDGRWHSWTLMGTLGYEGDTTAFTYEGGTEAMAMLAFIQQIRGPRRRRRHIVVSDRLSSHLDPSVVAAIERTGAAVWHLPPYSHDLNPIEQMWSKVKAYLRKAKARDAGSLFAAIAEARDTVTAADAVNWSRHCGYPHTKT